LHVEAGRSAGTNMPNFFGGQQTEHEGRQPRASEDCDDATVARAINTFAAAVDNKYHAPRIGGNRQVAVEHGATRSQADLAFLLIGCA
jgi:hypothetical protein